MLIQSLTYVAVFGGGHVKSEASYSMWLFPLRKKKRFGVSEVSTRNRYQNTRWVKNHCRRQRSLPILAELTVHTKCIYDIISR